MKSTFDLLQELDDGDFHGLCDDLLRRVESRYRLLTPHGRNERGQSIRGQPDSYVGNTAATCSIAFEYSIQKASWESKEIGRAHV